MADDDHAGAFVFEHIDVRYDGEDEYGLVLIPITLITASMRFRPFHRNKRRMRGISGTIYSCHRRQCRRQHPRRPHPDDGVTEIVRQTGRGSAGYRPIHRSSPRFSAFLLSFSDD